MDTNYEIIELEGEMEEPDPKDLVFRFIRVFSG